MDTAVAIAAPAAAGLALAAGVHALLARSKARRGLRALGPANRVTLVRAWLTCVVTSLVVAEFTGAAPETGPVSPLVGIAAAALVLDAVDGWVARRTGTVSALGARFDMEVDALLILVLSIAAARTSGWWVLGLGLARYVVLAAAAVQPWLRRTVVPQYWRKVVAATQGVVLTTVLSGLPPGPVALAGLVAAALLLALSFGTEVVELWRTRPRVGAVSASHPLRRRVAVVVAAVVAWFALAGPDHVSQASAPGWVALPLDAVVVLTALALVGRRVGRGVATVSATGLTLVVVLRVLDLGSDLALARPFDPLAEWPLLTSAAGLLSSATSPWVTAAVVAATTSVLAGVFLLLLWGARRLSACTARHRRATLGAGAALAVAWSGCALTGTSVGRGSTVATTGAVGVVVHHVALARDGRREQAVFDRGLASDPARGVPPGRLLRGLQGKDVVLVFVESYGRVALEGPSDVTAPVDAALARAGTRLEALGWSGRSAWLTSPTFGGVSWLAHSTLQTGLWVDTQRRHDALLTSDRSSLSSTFHRAGWRTVSVIPSDAGSWPEGAAFYGFDAMYDASNVGYRGPRLGYARVPDQFTLKALRDRELGAPGHPPVMAEVDLDSSHVPWAPLPGLLPWSSLDDGSRYRAMVAHEPTKQSVWSTRSGVRAAYGRSIAYSIDSLVSFVEASRDEDLVLVVLGDHQPASVVSGQGADHDVPVTILAHDPAVTARAAGWGWVAGDRPTGTAPVWRMDAFRDRFLAAYATPLDRPGLG